LVDTVTKLSATLQHNVIKIAIKLINVLTEVDFTLPFIKVASIST